MVAKGRGTLSLTLLYSLAGTAGFEPANAGIKTQCLTTWRRPTADRYMLLLSNLRLDGFGPGRFLLTRLDRLGQPGVRTTWRRPNNSYAIVSLLMCMLK